jgi:glycosylphosphatidylinositol transamidase (GPIT) subunit GPI8
MRDLANVVNAAESKYGAKKGVSTYVLKKQAEEKLILDYLKNHYGITNNKLDDALKTFKDKFKEDHNISVNNVIDYLLGTNNNGELAKIFSNNPSKEATEQFNIKVPRGDGEIKT